MPIVTNPVSAADFRQGHGLNDLIRRTFFPGLPPMECVGGFLFFPWGTGPFFPIPCDKDFSLMMLDGGAGRQFAVQTGSKFAMAVAEVGGIALEEATNSVARAAGLDAAELENLTVRDVGRKIFDRVSEQIGVRNVEPSMDDTVGAYFRKLGDVVSDFSADRAVEDLAPQTGLPVEKLRELRIAELGDYLDISGTQPGNTVAYSSGSTVCVSGNGRISCTQVTGWLEGALWGGVIGGAIGGGVGAAIGAVLGALFGWLF